MQVSDVVFGLVLLIILVWAMMIALNQNSMAIVINGISARQETLISEEKYCPNTPELSLVKQDDIGTAEYVVIPRKTEAKQLVLCVYEKRAVE